MPIKVGMISLGCPKNQVDAEGMLARLRDEGFALVNEVDHADVVIINTCGFIEDAKKESIENIFEMAQLKKEGTIKGIVVSGCLASRYADEMRKEMPEVDAIVAVGSAGEIARACRAACGGKRLSLVSPPELLPEGGSRILTTQPFTAYLKIAEGCSNRCSYCVIPSLRGRFRSRPVESLVGEARELAARGVRELTLVAQDTSRYGEDLYGRPALARLLRELGRIDGLQWLRVLYCYPERIDDALIEAIAGEPKAVKYIDMPLQHASARVLRAMNRPGDAESLLKLVGRLRAEIPGVVLRTTVMAGFPGETEKEFTELTDFLKEARFERLGAFAYSREEGTPAAELPGQLEEEVKRRRQEIILEQQEGISAAYNARQLGKTLRVLCEGYDRYAESYFGRSEADAPEIDGKIFFSSSRKIAPGTFINVKIGDTMDYDLIGAAVPET